MLFVPRKLTSPATQAFSPAFLGTHFDIDQEGCVNVRLYVSASCFIYEGWCGVSIWVQGFISLLWFIFWAFLCFVLVRVVWLRNSKGTQDPTALKSITGSYVVNIDDTRGFILEMRLSLEH